MPKRRLTASTFSNSKRRKKYSTLLSLPGHILCYIFEYCTVHQLITCIQLINKRCYRLIHSPQIWKNMGLDFSSFSDKRILRNLISSYGKYLPWLVLHINMDDNLMKEIGRNCKDLIHLSIEEAEDSKYSD